MPDSPCLIGSSAARIESNKSFVKVNVEDEAHGNFSNHRVSKEDVERQITNFHLPLAELDFTRSNRSRFDIYLSGAWSLAKSVVTRFDVTTPLFSFINYWRQPSDKTEAAIHNAIDSRIRELADADPEKLTALKNIDIGQYNEGVNRLTFGRAQLYDTNLQNKLLSPMVEDIFNGLSEQKNKELLHQHAKNALNDLCQQDIPLNQSDCPKAYTTASYTPTPDTIMLKYHIQVQDVMRTKGGLNNEETLDNLAKSLSKDIQQMNDFYLEMSAVSLEANSVELEKSIENIINMTSPTTCLSSIKKLISELTEVADKYGPWIYLGIFAAVFIERGGATTAKMEALGRILAPIMVGNGTTESSANNGTITPTDLGSLISDEDTLKKLENLFTVDQVDDVRMKPGNLFASCFASMLYIVGTLENAKERVKSNDIKGPSTELTHSIFEQLKNEYQGLLGTVDKGNGEEALSGENLVNLATSTADRSVSNIGIGASLIRVILNVAFEFKPALPNVPELNFGYSIANRTFIPSLVFESEGMKHDTIVQNEQNLIKVAKLKEYSNQELTDLEKDMLNFDRNKPSDYSKTRFKANCALFLTSGIAASLAVADIVSSVAHASELIEQNRADGTVPNLSFWNYAIPGTEDWFLPLNVLLGYKLIPITSSIWSMVQTKLMSADFNRYDMEHLGYAAARNTLGIIPAILWDFGRTTYDMIANVLDTAAITYGPEKGAANAKRRASAVRKIELLKHTLHAVIHMSLKEQSSTEKAKGASDEAQETKASSINQDIPIQDENSIGGADLPTEPKSLMGLYSSAAKRLKNSLMSTESVQKILEVMNNSQKQNLSHLSSNGRGFASMKQI